MEHIYPQPAKGIELLFEKLSTGFKCDPQIHACGNLITTLADICWINYRKGCQTFTMNQACWEIYTIPHISTQSSKLTFQNLWVFNMFNLKKSAMFTG